MTRERKERSKNERGIQNDLEETNKKYLKESKTRIYNTQATEENKRGEKRRRKKEKTTKKKIK